MAVLCRTSRGVLIDHLRYINDMYSQTSSHHHGNSTETSYKLKSDFFNIRTPFMMDSQFEKMKTQQAAGETNSCSNRKNKKRKFPELSSGEQDALDFHLKVREVLLTALQQLVALAYKQNHLYPSTQDVGDNNRAARQAAQIQGPGQDLVEMSTQCSDDSMETHKSFNDVSEHSGDHVEVLHILGCNYIIPPRCSYLMSDITYLTPLTHNKRQYDLIVIDPPWYNKSVKRKHKYRMLYDDELLDLPVPLLAGDGCLVVVWATNNQHQHRFIQDDLFPRWGVQYLTQWLWLKITRHGDTVLDLDNKHKKPYETIFLGYVNKYHMTPNHVTKTDHVTSDDNQFGNVTGEDDDMTGKDDHVTVKVDHVTGEDDHVTVKDDHVTGEDDHVTVKDDHVTGEDDHVTGEDDHVTVKDDHVTGEDDHVTGEDDHVTVKDHMIPEHLVNIPDNYIIISVPSSIHSHKPPLDDVLRPFLLPEPRCLEMFARSLQSGWFSWGNEVLKLQHVDYYET